jgi:hypothetical protein
MKELERQLGLEDRINQRYIEKVRQVDDLNHKIKQQFEVTMHKKIEKLEQKHLEHTDRLKRTHQEEKILFRDHFRQQYQLELKKVSDEKMKNSRT